jgi:hypothetical protein
LPPTLPCMIKPAGRYDFKGPTFAVVMPVLRAFETLGLCQFAQQMVHWLLCRAGPRPYQRPVPARDGAVKCETKRKIA